MEPTTPTSSTPQPSSTRPIFLGFALILVALIISGSIIGGAIIKDRGAERDSQISRSMMITGRASREITSDRMKWSFTVQRTGTSSSTVEDVSKQITKDIDSAISALAAAGVQNPTVSRHPMETHSYTNGGGYYDGAYSTTYNDVGGSQIVVIESTDVEKMNDASAGIIQKLTKDGAYVSMNQTDFYYSKTDDLRRELMQEALNDAKEQAKKIGGDKLGSLLQITGNSYLSMTPVNSSSGGYYGGGDDTTSLKKKASLDVSVSYAIKK